MKTRTGVLLGVLMTMQSAIVAATEKPPTSDKGDAGAKKPASRDMAKPPEARPPTLKDELVPKKPASKMSRKKEIKLNLCDR